MKRISILLSALVVTAFVAGIYAQPEVKKADSVKAAKVKKAKTKDIGKVASIDTTANTITVSNKNGSETYSIDANSKLKKGGKVITLSEIVVDDTVFVSFKEEAGKKVATSVTVKTKKAKK